MDPRNMRISHAGALGATMIIAGVVMKNSMEQLKKGDSTAGMVLFVLGWAIFANTISRNAVNSRFPPGSMQSMLPYVASGLVVMSVMMMKKAMKNANATKKKLYMAGFVAGWLLVAFSMGQNKGMAFGSVGLVFASMMYFLPKQRALAVVDGPGMPLFVIAWVGLIIANSDLARML